MSDRLKDLQRQRALAQEQVAWLDREIARESTGTTPAKPAAQPVAQPASPSAEDIIAQYQRESRPVHSEVKRGCFIYFFAALGVVILGVTALWFLRRP